MRAGRGTLFRLLCALSLLVAVAMGVVWLKSFENERQLLSFTKDGEKYSLKSKWGQFVFTGPPRQTAADPLAREAVWRMSNDDFDWSAIGSDYVAGVARRDSPTWTVYQRFLDRQRRGQGLEPAMRSWLHEALDDPSRFAPAHMLLMFAAEDHRKIPQRPKQKWKEISYSYEADGRRRPEVIMPADASAKGPEVSKRWDMREERSLVLDLPRVAVFHGWVFLAALVLPLAWAARPRWRQRSLRRWMVNWVVLVSSIVCAASTAMWVRSYWVDEQFTFEQRHGKTVAESATEFDSYRWIGSSKGKLKMLEFDTAHTQLRRFNPLGYERKLSFWALAPSSAKRSSGEKSLKFPGVEFFLLPTHQIVRGPAAPGTQQAAAPVNYGVRHLSIAWWLVVLVSAICPALWGWRAVRWRRRMHEENQGAIICRGCGYDMRATPGKCPECGIIRADAGSHGVNA